MQIIMSLVGMATIFGLAYLLSNNRAAINRRTIGIAFLIQVLIAALVLFVPIGGVVLDKVVKGVQYVINYGNDGIDFVFGTRIKDSLGFTIAFNVLPVIVFFAALMSVLYYLGLMQRVVGTFGGWLHRLLRTSHAESVSAVSNIFVGHTDAPLVVRPYLAKMTQSELFAVMTGGCATIAGAVMMGYAQMGVELKYLITASFMAAPGGLMMAKILVPETVPHEDTPVEDVVEEDRPANIFEAPVRPDLLHTVVVSQLAAKRRGTHATKNRAAVSGGGRKPFKQKGTGRARSGSLRSPQNRGGAVIFGPVVRDHGFDLPKKVRKLALKHALSAKAADGKLIVLDKVEAKAPKTKDLAGKLSALGVSSAVIVGGSEIDVSFDLAARNLPKIDVLPQQGINFYDILRRETLVLSRDAVEHLEARLT